MDPDAIADELRKLLDGLFHVNWVGTAATCAIIVAVTALASFLITRFIRSIMGKGKIKLPQSTIFVNVVRIVVWTIGVSIILGSCFNINVGALFTALGIGGIAISLGFQDTLSNLIGGLQVSVTGLVKPGDHITVGANTGVVRDVTWRHTSIVNGAGQLIVIPNSVINNQALVKLRPVSYVSLPLFVTTVPEQGGLDAVATDMENAANQAFLMAGIAMKKPATVTFGGMGEASFKGTLAFAVADSRHASHATDLAMRAIAPYAHERFFVDEYDVPPAPAPEEPPAELAAAAAKGPKQRSEHARRKTHHHFWFQRHRFQRRHPKRRPGLRPGK